MRYCRPSIMCKSQTVAVNQDVHELTDWPYIDANGATGRPSFRELVSVARYLHNQKFQSALQSLWYHASLADISSRWHSLKSMWCSRHRSSGVNADPILLSRWHQIDIRQYPRSMLAVVRAFRSGVPNLHNPWPARTMHGCNGPLSAVQLLAESTVLPATCPEVVEGRSYRLPRLGCYPSLLGATSVRRAVVSCVGEGFLEPHTDRCRSLVALDIFRTGTMPRVLDLGSSPAVVPY